MSAYILSVYDRHRRPWPRPGAEEGRRRAADPVAAGGAGPSWLRPVQADRKPFARPDHLPHRFALPAALSSRGARLDPRELAGKGRRAAAALLQAHRRRPARPRPAATD